VLLIDEVTRPIRVRAFLLEVLSDFQ